MAEKKDKRRRVIAPRLDDFVAKLLGVMMSYGEVVDHAMNEFDCDERTVTRAIARVRQGWQQASSASVDERRAKFLGELEHAMRGAIATSDYRALAVMFKTRADVEGIRAVKKVEHGGTINHRPVAAMAPQERQREIDVLLAKRQAAIAGGATPIIDTTAVEAPSSLDGDVDVPEVEVVRPKASKPGRKKPKAQVH
jgi:hypothetical protein